LALRVWHRRDWEFVKNLEGRGLLCWGGWATPHLNLNLWRWLDPRGRGGCAWEWSWLDFANGNIISIWHRTYTLIINIMESNIEGIGKCFYAVIFLWKVSGMEPRWSVGWWATEIWKFM
jgi:hypothetical protein